MPETCHSQAGKEEKKDQSAGVLLHYPVNVERALAMRKMSNEELVHKLSQCYPHLKEKKVAIDLFLIVQCIIVQYTD